MPGSASPCSPRSCRCPGGRVPAVRSRSWPGGSGAPRRGSKASSPGWVADRRAHGGRGGDADLLDVLLTADLTDAQIGAEVGTFMLAGHETTANALSWSLALLSALPAARERLEQEVNSVLGDRVPEAGDAGKLPWTAAVVNEAIRLYPPAWTIERSALAVTTPSRGTTVPAGEPGDDLGLPGAPAPGVLARPGRVRPRPLSCPDPVTGRVTPISRSAADDAACIGQSFAELEAVLVLRFDSPAVPAGADRGGVSLRPSLTSPCVPARTSRCACCAESEHGSNQRQHMLTPSRDA